MCSPVKLCETKHGYVSRCDKCRHIEFAFGTTILSMCLEQFFTFLETVETQYECTKHHIQRNTKQIYIATVARTITLVFTANEIASLYLLLSEAETFLNKENLFLFHKN